jgi:hypothetical protein
VLVAVAARVDGRLRVRRGGLLLVEQTQQVDRVVDAHLFGGLDAGLLGAHDGRAQQDERPHEGTPKQEGSGLGHVHLSDIPIGAARTRVEGSP